MNINQEDLAPETETIALAVLAAAQYAKEEE